MFSPVSQNKKGITVHTISEASIPKKVMFISIALTLIGLLLLSIGIGCGLAFNTPPLFSLIGPGILAFILGIGVLCRIIKKSITPLVSKTKIPSGPIQTSSPVTRVPRVRRFLPEEVAKFFKENFVLQPPLDQTRYFGLPHGSQFNLPEDLYPDNIRTYQPKGSLIKVHCIKGDPLLPNIKRLMKPCSILWNYINADGFSEVVQNSVTPDSWNLSQYIDNNLLKEGEVSLGLWHSSPDYQKKIEELKRTLFNWNQLGQIWLPVPSDYENNLKEAFAIAKQAFLKALDRAITAPHTVIQFPFPPFDKAETSPEWQSMISFALLEAIQEIGPLFINEGNCHHIVIASPHEIPFLTS